MNSFRQEKRTDPLDSQKGKNEKKWIGDREIKKFVIISIVSGKQEVKWFARRKEVVGESDAK